MARPQFRCLLLDKDKKLSSVYEELSADAENNNEEPISETPTVQVSTSETGPNFPFHLRITIEQATKMLRSDILWVTFELPIKTSAPAPPPNIRNAFDVLKKAQSTKSSLPVKYSNPVNGTLKVFNKLVELCQETGVFFRYFLVFCLNFYLIIFFITQARGMCASNKQEATRVSCLSSLEPFQFTPQSF